MKCFKIETAHVGVYYITNFDKHDTYLYKFIHHNVDWQVAGPTWASRQKLTDWKIIEISPLTLLVLLGESPEGIVKRTKNKKGRLGNVK